MYRLKLISHSLNLFKCLKKLFVQLRDFRCVRQFLTYDGSLLVANVLVCSRLDYCNSFFKSLSKFNLRKLQCFQDSVARIV